MVASSPRKIEISGDGLKIEEVAAVARGGLAVELSRRPEVRSRMVASRRLLENKLADGEIIYGINTGFGGNVRFLIPAAELRRHQRNLLQFMLCGTGPPLPEEAVRAAILLRANALAKGFSGVRLAVVERLLDLLNHGITPVVPRYGSVGASGDLIPAAYIARALLGEGEVFYRGRKVRAAEALRQEGLEPLELEAKEGLALINGTTVMTGLGALALCEGGYLASLALACCCLALEVLGGADEPFEAAIQEMKNHPGQIAAASICRQLLAGSQYVRKLDEIRRLARQRRREEASRVLRWDEAIQSPYSLRCVPQGIGPVLEAFEAHRRTLEREVNSANDNPLLEPGEGRVYHSGNFYGGHVAQALDGWKLAIATLANWLHALMAMLVDERFNGGLPSNLAPNPGLHSGFKGMQLCLTSLVCALRHLANPNLIHTLPTEQYNQDMVSLGSHAAVTAHDMTALLRDATAIVLIALCQGIDLRSGKSSLGQGDRKVYEAVRGEVPYLEHDRPLDEDIAKVASMIEKRRIEVPEP
jgi:phenylalanine ammonia-lyase